MAGINHYQHIAIASGFGAYPLYQMPQFVVAQVFVAGISFYIPAGGIPGYNCFVISIRFIAIVIPDLLTVTGEMNINHIAFIYRFDKVFKSLAYAINRGHFILN